MTTDTKRHLLDRPPKTPAALCDHGQALSPVAVLLLATAFLTIPWAPAPALDLGGYSMDILVDGRPVEELPHGGATYIEAVRGREYSIRLRNDTGERVAVALSVDGLSSIDARTTSAQRARKWILEPWQTLVLDGWQTSAATARRFFFTTEEDSYGAWLGRTRNLGVIAAAVFRERRPVPPPVPYALEKETRDRDGASHGQGTRSSADSPGAPAPAETPSPGAKRESDRRAGSTGNEAEMKSALSDELAATGIGRELSHRVRRVEFDAEPHPAAVLQVRYEYRDALVRLGVVPPCRDPYEPLARRERSRGFEDAGYAPDPYRHRR